MVKIRFKKSKEKKAGLNYNLARKKTAGYPAVFLYVTAVAIIGKKNHIFNGIYSTLFYFILFAYFI